MVNKPAFKDVLPLVTQEVEKRRGAWRLTTMDFDDVAQIVMLHVFNKYDMFDPAKGEFSHWLNTLIANAIKNILRDNLMKFNRPCIGCPFNTGGTSCTYTQSGEQDEECAVYARWKQKKEDEYNVRASLSLENHANEAQNMQCDFINIDEAKKVIDAKILTILNRREKRMYRLLYIKHKTPEQVGKILKYKTSPKAATYAGYQQLRKFQKRVVILAKQVIEDESLA